jgi:DedD protein
VTYDDRPEKAEHRETEITLSNTTLLFIFLGVAIICGVFFGFGYTIGKRNTAPAVAMTTPKAAEVAEVAPPVVAPVVATPAPAETAAEPDAAMSAKPSAAATPAAAAPAPVTPVPVVKAAPAPAPVVKTAPPPPVMKATPPPAPAPVAAKVVPPVTHPVVTPKPVAATKPAPVKTKQPAPAPAAPAAAPVTAPSRTYVVQVAAVSHQADADVLVGALRRKGFAVNSYPGTQDSLIHVQVGPFASQKDAMAMRDKLSDDGYLAIVK